MQIIANLAGSFLATPLVAWTLGWQEILIIVVVVLILFGGRKIPELAKGIGKGLREFKKEMRGVKQDFEEAARENEEDTYTAPRPKKRRKKPRKTEAETVAQDTEDEPVAQDTEDDQPGEAEHEDAQVPADKEA